MLLSFMTFFFLCLGHNC